MAAAFGVRLLGILLANSLAPEALTEAPPGRQMTSRSLSAVSLGAALVVISKFHGLLRQ
jgi:hypothetical protein